MNHNQRKLDETVTKQIKRINESKKQGFNPFGQLLQVGALGLLFVLPVIGGAYLGHWLDSRREGYSIGWTIGMIILGVIVGIFNIYFYMKQRRLND